MRDNKDKPLERIWNGIYVENPVFCLILGMCPTLATTTSATNAIGMGLSTTAILVASNLMISLLKGIIPNRMRIPSYIVIIASFVTIVEFLMEGFFPSVYSALGIYIPLIVVNCIIMGRAEAYAGKKGPVESIFDGLGMGLGFTLALLLIGSVREIAGAGTWFGFTVTPAVYEPVNIFILAPGAFLVMAFFVAVMNKLKIGAARRTGWDPAENGCADCSNCARLGSCGGKSAVDSTAAKEVQA
ncbi:MAG: electron transport complex subunit E [Lachnospiraceae bacterium]|nr:electron transport complex subunit E [Lachnospiraceae bacterium]